MRVGTKVKERDFRADLSILRHVTTGLSHHPDRRDVGRLASTGFHERTVVPRGILIGGARVGSGHISSNNRFLFFDLLELIGNLKDRRTRLMVVGNEVYRDPVVVEDFCRIASNRQNNMIVQQVTRQTGATKMFRQKAIPRRNLSRWDKNSVKVTGLDLLKKINYRLWTLRKRLWKRGDTDDSSPARLQAPNQSENRGGLFQSHRLVDHRMLPVEFHQDIAPGFGGINRQGWFDVQLNQRCCGCV